MVEAWGPPGVRSIRLGITLRGQRCGVHAPGARADRRDIFRIPLDLSVRSLIWMWPIVCLRKSVGHIHYCRKETSLASLTDCGYKIIIHWRSAASRLASAAWRAAAA